MSTIDFILVNDSPLAVLVEYVWKVWSYQGGNMTLMVGTGSKNALPIYGLFLYFMIVVQEVSSQYSVPAVLPAVCSTCVCYEYPL